MNEPESEGSSATTGTEDESTAPTAKSTVTPLASRRASRTSSRSSSRTASRASTIDLKGYDGGGGDDSNPDLERRFFSPTPTQYKRFSQMSWSDVADRTLRDKTDAIADIIRNISDQCAAAVEGLHMAQVAALEEDAAAAAAAEDDEDDDDTITPHHRRQDSQDSALLSPDGRSSVPPTPELSHRASTALSMASTATPERSSMGYSDIDVPTKIVEAEDGDEAHEEAAHYAEMNSKNMPISTKGRNPENIINRASARVSAFGTD